MENKKNIIDKLLNNNIIKKHINEKDSYGRTILNYSIMFKNVELILLLLNYNPDLNSEDINGNTIFFYILKYELFNILNEFAKLTFDVNHKNKEGIWILHYIWYNIFDKYVCEFVLKILNVDLNILTQQRYTPLILSIIWMNKEITKTLLYYGVDIEVQDNLGKTALFFSIDCQDSE